MNSDHLGLVALGGLGALFYSVPIYLKTRGTEDGKNALLTLGLSLLVGAAFGGLATPFIGAKFPWTVDPKPYPLALCVGLLANPLLPKLIEKGTSIFNAIGLGGNKS